MKKQIPESEHQMTNREKVLMPRRYTEWCRGCDAYKVPSTQKCPICRRRSLRRRLKGNWKV